MVVVTVFFESLWSTSIGLSSTLLSLSRCGPYDAVIFRTVFCVSQWAVCFSHLPHFGLWVAEVFIDVDFIAAVFIDVYLSTLAIRFAVYFFSVSTSSQCILCRCAHRSCRLRRYLHYIAVSFLSL
jgi:hypothetical protein